MAEDQPTEQPTIKPTASETNKIDRFAEHVNERKRRRNLWGHYVDEQSRMKSERTKPVHVPVDAETTKSKGTQTDDTPYAKDPNVDEPPKVDEKDVEGEGVKLTNEGVDEDEFVKTPCVGGLPEEQDNMDLYEP
ncbi:hypothetical protein J4E93_001225 [Alternaria ventricosa]|uniref:uncharacterized protein n=1 Tax=Alternaria ventricosa TaxID=1187951 RepID=UPI0020C539D5|nr:uncharacterized protein J4E93_001225 [Alternaria ventricosa]KAI4653459.1 hypothetical protein J4E93_001225 [Alternaria ventricosa]